MTYMTYIKVEDIYNLHGNLSQSVEEHHLPYWITQCNLPPDSQKSECAPILMHINTRHTYPEGQEADSTWVSAI